MISITESNGTTFISRIFSVLNISLIALLTYMLVYPEARDISTIRILSSVGIAVFSITYTIFTGVLLLGLVTLFLFAYTNKIDNAKIGDTTKLLASRKLIGIIKQIWDYAKLVALFYLTANLNYVYAASIVVLALIEKVIYGFMSSAIKAKIKAITQIKSE